MRTALLITLPFVLAACHGAHGRLTAPAVASVARTDARGEKGGVVGEHDGVRVEVVTGGGGRLVVYARDDDGLPVGVQAARAEVLVGGDRVPVNLAFAPDDAAYEGRVAGVPPGRHAMVVTLEEVSQASPVTVTVPGVRMDSVAGVPAPVHGGTVVAVGDLALELAADRCGQVGVYPRGFDGSPRETATMWVSSVRAERDGAVHLGWVVRTREAFVGRVDPMAPGRVDLVLDFNTHGIRYPALRVPGVVVGSEAKPGAACPAPDAPRLARLAAGPSLTASTDPSAGIAGADGP